MGWYLANVRRLPAWCGGRTGEMTRSIHILERNLFTVNCVAIALGPGLLAPIVAVVSFGCLLARAVTHQAMEQRFGHLVTHGLAAHGEPATPEDRRRAGGAAIGVAAAGYATADGVWTTELDNTLDRSLPVDCVALLMACQTVYVAVFLGYFYDFVGAAIAICTANWLGFTATFLYLRRGQHPPVGPRPSSDGATTPNDFLMEQLLPLDEAS